MDSILLSLLPADPKLCSLPMGLSPRMSYGPVLAISWDDFWAALEMMTRVGIPPPPNTGRWNWSAMLLPCLFQYWVPTLKCTLNPVSFVTLVSLSPAACLGPSPSRASPYSLAGIS